MNARPHTADTPRPARLQFALAVAVAGLVASLALDHLAELQRRAAQAVQQTLQAQQRTFAALAQARCGMPPPAAVASAAASFEFPHVPDAPQAAPPAASTSCNPTPSALGDSP